jgi:hypothetical protein
MAGRWPSDFCVPCALVTAVILALALVWFAGWWLD